MSTNHNRSNARIRKRVPDDLVAFASALRPVVGKLRALCEDATAAPKVRVYARLYLREGILRALRELDTRIDVVTRDAPATDGASNPDGGAA